MLAAAAKETTFSPALPLTQNSRLGFQLRSSTFRQGFTFAISNTATGLNDPGYEKGRGSRCSTYFRDSDTGLDYADQRYHAPGQGRFLSPDRYTASAGASSPGTWNRYGYGGGDPVNNVDPSGPDFCDSDAYLDGGVPLSCSTGFDVADVCAALLPNMEAAMDCEAAAQAQEQALAQMCQAVGVAFASGAAPWNGACGQAPIVPVADTSSACLNWCLMPQALNVAVAALRSHSRLSNSLFGTARRHVQMDLIRSLLFSSSTRGEGAP